MWMLYFVTFSIFILYHNKYKILLNIFSYLYPYMGWGKCSFQRADLVEGYGVRDIWITWKESERRTFWFFDFSSYLYKISFSFIIFFSQLHKKDWKWFFHFFRIHVMRASSIWKHYLSLHCFCISATWFL